MTALLLEQFEKYFSSESKRQSVLQNVRSIAIVLRLTDYESLVSDDFARKYARLYTSHTIHFSQYVCLITSNLSGYESANTIFKTNSSLTRFHQQL